MKKLLALTCAVFAMSAPLATPADAKSPEPFPVEYWAVRSQISNVQLSPDGKKLAFEKINSREGNPVIEIRDVNNLSGKPYTLGGKSMEITSFSWVGDQDMIVSFRDQVSKNIKGWNRGAYKTKTAHFNLRNNKFNDLTTETKRKISFPRLVGVLPDEPDTILIQTREFERGRSGSGFESDYYKLNLSNGKRIKVMSGEGKYDNVIFDSKGNPRLATVENAKEQILYFKKPGQENWREFYRKDRGDYEEFGILGQVENSDSEVYVEAHNGNDISGVYKFNLDTKTLGNLVYRHSDVDVWGAITHSNDWKHPNKIVGFSAYKDKFIRKFIDSSEEQIYKRFEASVANAGLVTIPSRSRDGQTMVVQNRSPKDPGTYYLYTANNGKFMKIGSANGLLKPTGLSDVEYITYKSRDGKDIPAFLTKPKGPGPHKLVVMPHGGPFVREVVLFDEWAQMLANNGYMVLQPQYRGSKGYGINFYQSAFFNGGEGGRKMQDDKDDGVKHLIEQGIVDKDKVAFFGWSYGGYAALIAAARSPNLYKCSIAGAAVADNFQQVNYYRTFLSMDTVQGKEQLNMWTDSVDPIEEVDKVNIPLFVIHGSIDQRVPPVHAKKYVSKLKSKKKDHKYLELKNADHFSNTLFYKHKMKMYPAMLDYLKNECGM